jgi:predicted DNA-binding helix-hairpin-helix protein
MQLHRKLAMLADAAKYDASCALSGTTKRDSLGGNGIGSTDGSGIEVADLRCSPFVAAPRQASSFESAGEASSPSSR